MWPNPIEEGIWTTPCQHLIPIAATGEVPPYLKYLTSLIQYGDQSHNCIWKEEGA